MKLKWSLDLSIHSLKLKLFQYHSYGRLLPVRSRDGITNQAESSSGTITYTDPQATYSQARQEQPEGANIMFTKTDFNPLGNGENHGFLTTVITTKNLVLSSE
jgi:hypothetical protein